MGLIRLMKRFGGGYAAVQPTDQIACDLSLTTITPTGGASARLPDLLATVQCVTPPQFKAASDPDDTNSIQEMVNYAAANGVCAALSGRNYYISKTIACPSNLRLLGSGMNFTQIIQTSTSIPAFALGSYNNLAEFTISWVNPVQTGATGVLASGVQNCLVNRLTVNGSDVCFEVTNSSVITFRDVFGNIIRSSGLWVHGTPNTAAGAASGVVTDCRLEDFIFAAGGIADTNTGTQGILRITDAVESFVAINGELLFGNVPLYIDSTDSTPSDRKMPQFNKFTNVFCDSNAQGAHLRNLTTHEFESCWFSTGRSGSGFAGVDMDNCDSVTFSNTNFFECGSHGVHVGPNAKNTVFNVCKANGNGSTAGGGDGLHFSAGATDFSVIGCIGSNIVGATAQNYLAYVENGPSDRYSIIGNRCAGNAQPAGIYDGGTGTNKVLLGNF